jgi:hypothetical protein
MQPQEISMNVSQDTFWGFLVEAAREGDADYYFTLIASGADPLQRREYDQEEYDRYCYDDDAYGETYYRTPVPTQHDTILCIAARSGCARIVEHLIGLGEDIQHIGQSGYPALAYWAKGWNNAHKDCQREETFRLLIEAGATPDDHDQLARRVLASRGNDFNEHADMELIHQWDRDKARNALDENTIAAPARRSFKRL